MSQTPAQMEKALVLAELEVAKLGLSRDAQYDAIEDRALEIFLNWSWKNIIRKIAEYQRLKDLKNQTFLDKLREISI